MSEPTIRLEPTSPTASPPGPVTGSSAGRRTIDGRAVRRTSRCVVGLVVVLHGLIHLLGAAKGLGAADVTQLTKPISTGLGAGWLLAAILTVAAGLSLLARASWWWKVGAAAVVLSQAVILTSWTDARAGTLANVILLVAVVYGYASQGPRSARAEYHRRTTGALQTGPPVGVVTHTDLARLPAAVAAYVRQSGAVGQPHVQAFRAQFHGRIRGGPTSPWMTFTGEQVNTYGPQPSRLFIMDAELLGLPVEVLHAFEAGAATMRVRACSMFTMVNAKGPEMDRAETVTLFNDLCVLAPAALLDAPVTWQPVDASHVRAAYTYGANTITAELTFNSDHELVDFVSDDRMVMPSDGGTTFTPQRWSTPLSGYRQVGSRRLGTFGEGHWHAPGGEFAYLEYDLDDIAYDAAQAGQPTTVVRPSAPEPGS